MGRLEKIRNKHKDRYTERFGETFIIDIDDYNWLLTRIKQLKNERNQFRRKAEKNVNQLRRERDVLNKRIEQENKIFEMYPIESEE